MSYTYVCVHTNKSTRTNTQENYSKQNDDIPRWFYGLVIHICLTHACKHTNTCACTCKQEDHNEYDDEDDIEKGCMWSVETLKEYLDSKFQGKYTHT